jgi:mRNA-degrading endonuclease RelE of RelBE toxin-antitoxin system
MKTWKIRATFEASRLLSSLHPEIKKQLKQSLNELRQNPYIGKDLQEELSGFKSLRQNKYRIIYNINNEEKIIQIFYIGRRIDIYEQFRKLLTGFE